MWVVPRGSAWGGRPVRFDYYQAGITGKPADVVGQLESSFDLVHVAPAKAYNGYEEAVSVVRGDHVLVTAMWGGNTGDRVLVKGTGADSPEVAEVIRETWPWHRVVRADVCEDYDEEGAFSVLSGMALNVADQHRVKVRHEGDWHREEDGRTLYLGSRQSVMYMRLYEKGKQLRGMGLESASPDHVRVEFEVKPKRDQARLLMSKMEPKEFLGGSVWSYQIAGMLLESSISRVKGLGTIRVPTDRDRALKALRKQYGRHLTAIMEEEGSWEAVGRLLGNLIERRS